MTFKPQLRRLMRAVDQANRSNFTWFGAVTRREARKSIKRKNPTKKMLERLRSADRRKSERARQTIRKRMGMVSQPGQPPFSKDPQDRIRRIKYEYDPHGPAVIVGIVKLGGVKGPHTPRVIEHGGSSVAITYQDGKKKRIRIRVRARPVIGPAARKVYPKFEQRVRGSVK